MLEARGSSRSFLRGSGVGEGEQNISMAGLADFAKAGQILATKIGFDCINRWRRPDDKARSDLDAFFVTPKLDSALHAD
jgi:hypothetical protein